MTHARSAPLTEEEIDHAAALLRARIALYFLLLAERLLGDLCGAPLQAWIARTRRTVRGVLLLRALRRANPAMRRPAAPGPGLFRRLTRRALPKGPGDAAAQLRLLQAALDAPEAPVARLIQRLERGPHGAALAPRAPQSVSPLCAPSCAAPARPDTS